MVDLEILETILKHDPDGWEQDLAPTDVDYEAFEYWARSTFGDEAWEIYSRRDWGKGYDW